MGSILIGIFKKLLVSLATEVFIKKVLIAAAEAGAENTKTKFDDKLVAATKEALNA